MIDAEQIAARREAVASDPQLAALLTRLVARSQAVIDRMPPVPRVKALLSRDGGVCPEDGAPLEFDPWSPERHRCARCGSSFEGDRHHRHWARMQHLWLAERAAELATVHAITGDERASLRAREILTAYHQLYFDLPNRDNVLGPSHLFFSTYLESIWILDYLAAAIILRETGELEDADADAVSAIADEAATLIGEFDEGLSNRQTWHAAALTAIAVWFGDDDLAATAITGRAGLLGHLADGFGDDGMWHEGENYHLFAMRGLLVGLHWATAAGAALTDDAELGRHLGQALMAPSITALPDFTFPARKDSRYGVSLAHPAYVECWEAGATLLGERAPDSIDTWLDALYARPAQPELVYDAYLHDAGLEHAGTPGPSGLSWWGLWLLRPVGERTHHAVRPDHDARLLEQQGVAIVRDRDRYVAMECIGGGGGHGHPDRLHLTVHAGGVHWLPDPGTGSYVARDLFWYRSTLAHNAPRVDGVDQPRGQSAQCTAFDSRSGWTHIRTTWATVERTVIAGPRWVIDVVRSVSDTARVLELAWHPSGSIEVASGEPTQLAGDFVSDVQLVGEGTAQRVMARAGDQVLALHLDGGEVIVAQGPGLPGSASPARFLVQRGEGLQVRFTNVIDPGATVRLVDVGESMVTVHDDGGATTVAVTATEVTVTAAAGKVVLGGMRQRSRAIPTLGAAAPAPARARAAAMRVEHAPALDGSLDGFDIAEPLTMDDELSYFRSESAYGGPDEFGAVAWVNWDTNVLYLAVEVTKPHVVTREADAGPLMLDNEPDDIHADGVQAYIRMPDGPVTAWLLRPTSGRVVVRGIGATDSAGVVAGWQRTAEGYRITAALPVPGLDAAFDSRSLAEFDVVVNEMQPGRLRRAGQLAWSSGPGWVYLRGDRHDPDRFGLLELHP